MKKANERETNRQRRDRENERKRGRERKRQRECERFGEEDLGEREGGRGKVKRPRQARTRKKRKYLIGIKCPEEVRGRLNSAKHAGFLSREGGELGSTVGLGVGGVLNY